MDINIDKYVESLHTSESLVEEKPKQLTENEKSPFSYTAQLGLYNPDKDFNPPVIIFGLGMIGSWTALFLAKMGIRHLDLVDFDKVEGHNLANQAYRYHDVGALKAHALESLITNSAPDPLARRGVIIKNAADLPGMGYKLSDSIFVSAVDSFHSRKIILQQAMRHHPMLLVDGRIGGNAYEVHTVPRDTHYEKEYMDELLAATDTPREHNDAVAQVESVTCAARGIVDVGVSCAAKITASIRLYLTKSSVINYYAEDVATRNIVKK